MTAYTHKQTTQKQERQRQWLDAYTELHSITEACKKSGVPLSTLERWRSKDRGDADFAQEYREISKSTPGFLKWNLVEGRSVDGLLFDSTRELLDKGTFADWRRRYM